jgi:preprotein translocase subunit YajC
MQHPGMAMNMAPFLILMVVWVFFFFRRAGQERRELQRDIDELNALGRG